MAQGNWKEGCYYRDFLNLYYLTVHPQHFEGGLLVERSSTGIIQQNLNHRQNRVVSACNANVNAQNFCSEIGELGDSLEFTRECSLNSWKKR